MHSTLTKWQMSSSRVRSLKLTTSLRRCGSDCIWRNFVSPQPCRSRTRTLLRAVTPAAFRMASSARWAILWWTNIGISNCILGQEAILWRNKYRNIKLQSLVRRQCCDETNIGISNCKLTAPTLSVWAPDSYCCIRRHNLQNRHRNISKPCL